MCCSIPDMLAPMWTGLTMAGRLARHRHIQARCQCMLPGSLPWQLLAVNSLSNRRQWQACACLQVVPWRLQYCTHCEPDTMCHDCMFCCRCLCCGPHHLHVLLHLQDRPCSPQGLLRLYVPHSHKVCRHHGSQRPSPAPVRHTRLGAESWLCPTQRRHGNACALDC